VLDTTLRGDLLVGDSTFFFSPTLILRAVRPAAAFGGRPRRAVGVPFLAGVTSFADEVATGSRNRLFNN